jgi:hypothetical protein
VFWQLRIVSQDVASVRQTPETSEKANGAAMPTYGTKVTSRNCPSGI